MDIDALLRLARDREEAELAKPLEQRRREYRESHLEQWESSEEGRLCLEFYKAYTAYKEYLRMHMRDWRPGNGIHWSLKSTRCSKKWRAPWVNIRSSGMRQTAGTWKKPGWLRAAATGG